MPAQTKPSLVKYALLSVAVALATMAIKTGAYVLTHSVGLLSDALESLVNLTAALFAVRVLYESSKPPDKEHAYGHSKAEYFSSLFEGIMIGIASISIAYTAIRRLLEPEPIQQIPLGLALAAIASILNFLVARLLLDKGKVHQSIALEADGQHLMADVWTSVGVLVGVGTAALTGLTLLDPLIALVVAGKIGWTGLRLIQRSVQGLMDASLPESQIQGIKHILEAYTKDGVRFHALRTRQAGAHGFISVHVITPGDWSVMKGHDLLESIERDIQRAVPLTTVFTHLEPLEDPRSWDDPEAQIDEGLAMEGEESSKND
jgi:cation diffusion facilitator family transporter